MFPSPHILRKIDLELYIPCTICVFGGTPFRCWPGYHSTFLKHYKVLLSQEQKHRIASRALALDTARVAGVFYITNLVVYIIHFSYLWE